MMNDEAYSEIAHLAKYLVDYHLLYSWILNA